MGRWRKIKGKLQYRRPSNWLASNMFVGVFRYIPKSTPPNILDHPLNPSGSFCFDAFFAFCFCFKFQSLLLCCSVTLPMLWHNHRNQTLLSEYLPSSYRPNENDENIRREKSRDHNRVDTALNLPPVICSEDSLSSTSINCFASDASADIFTFSNILKV